MKNEKRKRKKIKENKMEKEKKRKKKNGEINPNSSIRLGDSLISGMTLLHDISPLEMILIRAGLAQRRPGPELKS